MNGKELLRFSRAAAITSLLTACSVGDTNSFREQPSQKPTPVRYDSFAGRTLILTPTKEPQQFGKDSEAVRTFFPAMAEFPVRIIPIPAENQKVTLYNFTDYLFDIDAYTDLREYFISLADSKKRMPIDFSVDGNKTAIEFSRLNVPVWNLFIVANNQPNYFSEEQLKDPMVALGHQFGVTDTDRLSVGVIVVREATDAQLEALRALSKDSPFYYNKTNFLNAALTVETCNSIVLANHISLSRPGISYNGHLPFDSNELLCGSYYVALGYRFANQPYEAYKNTATETSIGVRSDRYKIIVLSKEEYAQMPAKRILTAGQ